MRATLVVLFLLLSSVTFAQEPPFDFKGIALGSDISAARSNSKFECYEMEKRPPHRIVSGDHYCSHHYSIKGEETIAGAPIRNIYLYYYFGKLERIEIRLWARDFHQVLAALQEKYGPGSVKTETVQNRMGATFENSIYPWRRNSATLEAKKYEGDLEISSLDFETDFARQEAKRRRAGAAKKGAKDL